MTRLFLIFLLTAGLTSAAWANTASDRDLAREIQQPRYPRGAIEFFTFVIEAGEISKQDLAQAFYRRGNAFYYLGELERAIEEFSRALVLDPRHANAYYNRANAFADLGQHGRAVEDYTAAIRLEPDHDFAFFNRANAYSAKGDQGRAVQDYKKAYALNPADPVYQDKLRELGLFR
ncbi:MAG: tetratricopeptide repeat protein [Rhodospirillales bacterium]|nr:tetratricopeptide repeat protein [Rhodospirillales bacterium]